MPAGCYELKAINAEIICICGNSDITNLPNVNTLRCILTVVEATWVNHGKICDFACCLPLKASTWNLFYRVVHFDETSGFDSYIESVEMYNYYKSIPSGLILHLLDHQLQDGLRGQQESDHMRFRVGKVWEAANPYD